MEKLHSITPVFTTVIPMELEHGKLYISKRFGVAIHLCACGCGEKSVTPISFKLRDGIHWLITRSETKEITLEPSIGNFSGESPYHAHYYIKENKIQWC
jgi:hypothetical protein